MSPANPYEPKPVAVGPEPGSPSLPATVAGRRVEAIREQWLVEDRWWSGSPLRRHYLEIVLTGGRCTVVFRDLVTGHWFEQR